MTATPTAEATRARLSPAARQRGGRGGRRQAPEQNEDEPEDRVEIGAGPAEEAVIPASDGPGASGEHPHIDVRV